MATKKKTPSLFARLIGTEKIAEAIQADFNNMAAEAPELVAALVKGRQVPVSAERLSAFDGIRTEMTKVFTETAAKHREMRKQHSEQLQGTIAARGRRLEAYALRKRTVIKPRPDGWVVAGRVTDKSSKNGIPNLLVRAYDMDRVVDDYLGTARSDALGYYRIEYTEEVFKTRGEGQPEVFILVLDDNKNTLFTSPKSFVEKSGTVQKIDARIDGGQVPGKMKLSRDVNSFVTKTLNNFNERRKVLDNRKAAVTKPLVILKRPGSLQDGKPPSSKESEAQKPESSRKKS